MLVVIFGAGASYDSADLEMSHPEVSTSGNLRWRPPLAKQLFDPARHNFNEAVANTQQMIPILGRLRRAARDEEALEDVLEKLEAEAGAYPPRHRQLLGVRVYLQRIIAECGTRWRELANGVTHYDELIDEVERWRQQNTGGRVLYVTFNYDAMLEDAVSLAYGWRPLSLDDYVEHQHFAVLKLHGSVDWGRLTDLRATATDMTRLLWDRAGAYNLGDFIFGSQGVGLYNNEIGVVPAIAVPIANKREFECPADHLQLLHSAIEQATKVITVGWRGAERHFLKLWGRRNDQLDLYVVSGSKEAAEETNGNLHAGGLRSNRVEHGEGGFGHFLGSGELRRFLDRPARPRA